ncbi:hypothetical protein DFH09DRAFT_1088612 [Mycena vulgaris]|nr:hypothetical protein DFH09DRAFT_1088612 [Mycena vulgaris]
MCIASEVRREQYVRCASARWTCAREATSGLARVETLHVRERRKTGGLGTHRGEIKSGRDVETPAGRPCAGRIGVVVLEACAAWRSFPAPIHVEETAAEFRTVDSDSDGGGIESRAGVREHESWPSKWAGLGWLSDDDDEAQGRWLTGLWERDAEDAEGGRFLDTLLAHILGLFLRRRRRFFLGLLGGIGVYRFGPLGRQHGTANGPSSAVLAIRRWFPPSSITAASRPSPCLLPPHRLLSPAVPRRRKIARIILDVPRNSTNTSAVARQAK